MKLLLYISLLFLLALPVRAYDIEVLLPIEKHHTTKNLHIFIDFSGSLVQRGLIDDAVEQALLVASQGADEFNIAVTVFANTSARMEITDPNCETGPNWIAMPSAENVEFINGWLYTVRIRNDNTLLRNPLYSALQENVEELSIVVISDGHFYHPEIARLLQTTEVPVSFIGLDMDEVTKTDMTRMIRVGGERGGLMNIRSDQ